MKKWDAFEYIIQELEKYVQQYKANSVVPDLMKIYPNLPKILYTGSPR